jgi:hypothetical protein
VSSFMQDNKQGKGNDELQPFDENRVHL